MEWICWMTSFLRFWRKRKKIHDYTSSIHGVDYVFEKIGGDALKGCMTAQKQGVKRGDRVLLMQSEKVEEYQIQEITYYCAPSDMWIALLTKVN